MHNEEIVQWDKGHEHVKARERNRQPEHEFAEKYVRGPVLG